MNSTQLRNRVRRLLKEDPSAALRTARQIPEPWFRAQALSAVGRQGAENQVEPLAKEAMKAAAECEDDYRRAAVAAWPIRLLVERGHTSSAAEALAVARQYALVATPIGSRAEALFGLLNGAWGLGGRERRQLVEDLLALHGERLHWRVARATVAALEMMGPCDREAAGEIAGRIPDDRCRRKAIAALDAEDPQGPREYFHGI